MNFNSENIFYCAVLGISSCLIAFYFYKMNYLHQLSINKPLNSLGELRDYSNLYLFDYFSLEKSSQLTENFLSNYQLFHFLTELLILYPALDFVFFDIPLNDSLEIKSFLNSIKDEMSFEDFKKYKINKRVFFNFLFSINKYIFLNLPEN